MDGTSSVHVGVPQHHCWIWCSTMTCWDAINVNQWSLMLPWQVWNAICGTWRPSWSYQCYSTRIHLSGKRKRWQHISSSTPDLASFQEANQDNQFFSINLLNRALIGQLSACNGSFLASHYAAWCWGERSMASWVPNTLCEWPELHTPERLGMWHAGGKWCFLICSEKSSGASMHASTRDLETWIMSYLKTRIALRLALRRSATRPWWSVFTSMTSRSAVHVCVLWSAK